MYFKLVTLSTSVHFIIILAIFVNKYKYIDYFLYVK